MSSAADVSRTKRPKTVLAGPYGHPFHPILVTVPIGAWASALVFGVVSRFVDDPVVFATGGRWLIGIGVIGAVAAAVFGLLDFSNIPPGTLARRVGLTHLTLNVVTTVLFVVAWWLWPQEDAVTALPLAVTGVALAVLGVSGWLGGTLTYRYGIRVADEGTQRRGFRSRR